MMRNIEIKASIQDVEALKLKAKELSGADATIIQQTDTFFKVPKGRVKLRQFKDGTGELIYYDRPDTAGPKLSTYQKVNCPDDSYSRGLLEILRLSMGILGTVEKTRYLYLVGQSRVHIDDVRDLGAFAEIEVVLTSDQTIEDGQKIMANLMKELGIKEDALLSTAYLDIILAKNHSANT